MPTASRPASVTSTSRAKAGGQTGINGYFYKGGQFLPNTQAEPGKWKVAGKWVKSGRALVAPGEFAHQPTPFSRSLFELASVGASTVLEGGLLSVNKGAQGKGVRFANGEVVTRDTEIRPGVKGILGKESLTLGEIIDAWNSGQRWFDVLPEAPTITDSPQETPGQTPKQQSAASKKNLILLHNLSAENLLHADSLGGLPAPSLAISRLDAPLDGFGAITLIGDAWMATPGAGNPVFDADVYSPRFPRIKVKVDEKAVREALNPLMAAAADIGYHAKRPDPAIEKLKRNQLGDAVSDASYDIGMRLGFAKVVLGKKLSVPMMEVAPTPVAKAGASIIEQSPLAELLPTLDIGNLTPETAGDLGQKVYAALVNKTFADLGSEGNGTTDFEKEMELVNRRIRLFAISTIEEGCTDFAPDKVGAMTPRGLLSLYNLVRNSSTQDVVHSQNAKRQEVDLAALNELLDKEAPRAVFESWLHSTFLKSLGERRVVKENGRTAPYTLNEIVREMTRKVRDAEGFNYGLGNARSKGAKKFKTLRQLQQHSSRLTSAEQLEEVKKEIDKELSALVRELTPYRRYKNDSGFEALLTAIGDSYSAPLSVALRNAALDNVPEDLRLRIEQFAATLVNAPTEYFEAKPQRAVRLNEFRGAVIPSSTTAQVRAVLEKHGLRVQEYDSKDAGSRRQAVARLAEVLDEERSEILGDVIFSRGNSKLSFIEPQESDARFESVQKLVSGIQSTWVNCPPIVVVRNIHDERVRSIARESDARMSKAGAGDARGFFHAGTVYLLSDALPCDSETVKTLFHEALGHYGLRSLFGKDLTPILHQIIAERHTDVLQKASEYRLPINEDNLLLAAEEVLVDMAQTRPELSLVERATATIRTWLRSVVPGFINMPLTDNDIIATFIIPARNFVEQGLLARKLNPENSTPTEFNERIDNNMGQFEEDEIWTKIYIERSRA